jgi:hypothetical protein
MARERVPAAGVLKKGLFSPSHLRFRSHSLNTHLPEALGVSLGSPKYQIFFLEFGADPLSEERVAAVLVSELFALRARDLSARLGPLGALSDAPKGSLASYATPLHDIRVWA